MKKLALGLVVFIVVATAFLSGCSTTTSSSSSQAETTTESEVQEQVGYRNLVDIEDQGSMPYAHLVYDSETFIVYYKYQYKYTKVAAAYLCPFYSENGRLCRYNVLTSEIEEIIN